MRPLDEVETTSPEQTRRHLAEITESLLDPMETVDIPEITPDELADLARREPAVRRLLAETRAAQNYARALRLELDNTARAPLYRDWLDSDEWRAMADAAIARAAGACQLCKSTTNLEVHHNTYIRFGGRELDTDLVCLCDGCHTMTHLTRNLQDKCR